MGVSHPPVSRRSVGNTSKQPYFHLSACRRSSRAGIQSAIQGEWVFTRRIEDCAKPKAPGVSQAAQWDPFFLSGAATCLAAEHLGKRSRWRRGSGFDRRLEHRARRLNDETDRAGGDALVHCGTAARAERAQLDVARCGGRAHDAERRGAAPPALAARPPAVPAGRPSFSIDCIRRRPAGGSRAPGRHAARPRRLRPRAGRCGAASRSSALSLSPLRPRPTCW